MLLTEKSLGSITYLGLSGHICKSLQLTADTESIQYENDFGRIDSLFLKGLAAHYIKNKKGMWPHPDYSINYKY